MCNPALITMAGAGLSAGSAIGGGMAAEGAAKAQAAMLDTAAQHEREAGQMAADRIHRRAEYERGSAAATFAAAGIRVGSGSAAEVDKYIAENADHDAMLTVVNSSRRAVGLQYQGRMQRLAGRNARIAGYIQGAGSLLQGGYNASKWPGADPAGGGTDPALGRSWPDDVPTRGGR